MSMSVSMVIWFVKISNPFDVKIIYIPKAVRRNFAGLELKR